MTDVRCTRHLADVHQSSCRLLQPCHLSARAMKVIAHGSNSLEDVLGMPVQASINQASNQRHHQHSGSKQRRVSTWSLRNCCTRQAITMFVRQHSLSSYSRHTRRVVSFGATCLVMRPAPHPKYGRPVLRAHASSFISFTTNDAVR